MASMADTIFFLCFLLGGLFVFFCTIFHNEISDYIRACSEAKRNQEKRFKLIDDWLKKELKEGNYDAD